MADDVSISRATAIHKAQPGWRRVIAQAVLWGVPTPAFSTALAFFDGYRSEIVPANIIQGQRDYFGAHTFKVLPGKENDKLKSGVDIRACSPASPAALANSHLRQISTGLDVVATSLRRPTMPKGVPCTLFAYFPVVLFRDSNENGITIVSSGQ